MDGLRWLLLGIGLFVVAGVYLYTRRERERGNVSQDSEATTSNLPRVEPSLELPPEPELFGDDPAAQDASPDVEDVAPPVEQKVVTLRLVAGGQDTLAGDELVLSLRGIGMRHGKFGIFHRYEGSDEDKVIFSAASLVEPGSFDLTNIKDQKFPGISIFMILPGPVDGAEGFDLMTAAGRTLAQSLKAELLDESGSTLSIQRERYLREEIIEYSRRILVA